MESLEFALRRGLSLEDVCRWFEKSPGWTTTHPEPGVVEFLSVDEVHAVCFYDTEGRPHAEEENALHVWYALDQIKKWYIIQASMRGEELKLTDLDAMVEVYRLKPGGLSYNRNGVQIVIQEVKQ